MKIQPHTLADPLNHPKSAALPLKPLAASDFAQRLGEATDAPADSNTPGLTHSRLRPLSPIEMIPGVKGAAEPLKPLEPPTPPLLPLGEGGTTFQPGNPSRRPKTEHEKIQEQARKWVSQTFYGTMLKQMRESPFKSDLFSGGRGGQAFTPMLDQHLADRMSRSTDSHLVRSIARKLEAKSAPPQQSPQAPKPSPPPAKSPVPTDNPYQNVRIHVAPSLRA